MKSKDQKYEEAVERNLADAERDPKSKVRGKSLDVAKGIIGIRSGEIFTGSSQSLKWEERLKKLIKG